MPNYVENDLFVTGKSDEVNRFIHKCITEDSLLDFNQFVPMPSDLSVTSTSKPDPELAEKYLGSYLDNIKKYGARTWYDWCPENWGTKWNAIDVVIRHNYVTNKYKHLDNGVLIKFETAWSPPCPVILAMSYAFPTLKFALRYYEMGNEFKGRYAIKNGRLLCDRVEHYSGNRGG